MEDVGDFFDMALGLGLGAESLDAWQMALRAVVVFIAAIAMVRLGHKRFMGRNTTIDVLLGFILGSVLSRAITGNAPFFPALAASLTLVCVHWLLTAVSFHWHRLGFFFTGRERCLVRDGVKQRKEWRKAHILDYDLEEALRHKGWEEDTPVQSAYLERSGSINVVVKP